LRLGLFEAVLPAEGLLVLLPHPSFLFRRADMALLVRCYECGKAQIFPFPFGSLCLCKANLESTCLRISRFPRDCDQFEDVACTWPPPPPMRNTIDYNLSEFSSTIDRFGEVVRKAGLSFNTQCSEIDRYNESLPTLMTQIEELNKSQVFEKDLMITDVKTERDLNRRVWMIECLVIDHRGGGNIEHHFNCEIHHSTIVKNEIALEDQLMYHLRSEVLERFGDKVKEPLMEQAVRVIRIIKK
jgi:hypothetical protein